MRALYSSQVKLREKAEDFYSGGNGEPYGLARPPGGYWPACERYIMDATRERGILRQPLLNSFQEPSSTGRCPHG